MSAVNQLLDLTPPPVVKKISQRSLVIGIVFALISVALAYAHPDEFYRAYLLGFMCWLGVALGSMAILMIRHLTGGGWGTVIRRILGAAMRTLPLLAVLFIPMIVAVWQQRIYPWAMPLGSIQDPHIREHLEKHSFPWRSICAIGSIRQPSDLLYYSRRLRRWRCGGSNRLLEAVDFVD